MFVQQFFVKGIAHSSYLLGGTKTCAIVDPQRDVQIYIDAAQEMGMQITHILETHLHADFISGHLDLADRTGAAIYIPKSGGSAFKHVPVAEGDTFSIEDMNLKVHDTPGHTPEHISYVVTDRARGAEPAVLFCGDTLFVGDVGRPDLFPGKARELASQLYESLHTKLLTLPDFCEVYPAHGAGSLCGRTMGAKRTSTIGYERLYNAALQIKDEEEFIRSLTEHMPAAPDHFSRCSAINGKGPRLIKDLPALAPLAPPAFRDLARKDTTVVLDTRTFESFGGLHVPGSYHIDLRGNFGTFAGWIIPPDKDILLVSETPDQAREATIWLRRVGLDRTAGYLNGGMNQWTQAGFAIGRIPQLSAEELQQMAAGKRNGILVDVRAPGEYEGYHIKNAINIPVQDLRTRYKELDKKADLVLTCSTGMRSSMGASLLKMNGFTDVYSVAGGMTGYTTAGYAT
jgi:glyoxylase-like metal-dependent hydrolase (beta-lactamase superfamily II)/rhodanese-related sulfurtransferase